MRKKALVFLAEGFEEIEAVTSIDILRRAGVDVTVAGRSSGSVTGSRGIGVTVEADFNALKEEYDAYVLPGGSKGAHNLAGSKEVTALVKEGFGAGKIIAAICAAPAVVLAPMGILNGKTVTAYPDFEKDLPPDTRYSSGNVVVDGNVITSRGPATALDFALTVAERLVGREISEKVRHATLAVPVNVPPLSP